MADVDLRPLSLGELLDRTFSLYRSNFWLFVGIMSLPMLLIMPVTFASYLIRGSVAPSMRPMPPSALLQFWTLLLIFLPFSWLAHALAWGATTNAVSGIYLGQRITLRGAYGALKGRFWTLIGTIILVGLIFCGIFVAAVFVIVFGTTAVVTPMFLHSRAPNPAIIGLGVVAGFVLTFGVVIWLMLRFAVVIPAVLLENGIATAAIRRSIELTKGRRWQVFLAVLLSFVIVYIGVIVFQVPWWVAAALLSHHGVAPIPLMILSALSGAFGGAITGPILMIVLVLFYYDLRVRKEAFDVRHMLASLGPAETPGPVPSV